MVIDWLPFSELQMKHTSVNFFIYTMEIILPIVTGEDSGSGLGQGVTQWSACVSRVPALAHSTCLGDTRWVRGGKVRKEYGCGGSTIGERYKYKDTYIHVHVFRWAHTFGQISSESSQVSKGRPRWDE